MQSVLALLNSSAADIEAIITELRASSDSVIFEE
jgi:hypothetical protein